MNAEVKEIKRKNKLRKQCSLNVCFEHEGRIYLGSPDKAVQMFIENNPNPADFSVWLQKNFREVK